MRQLSSLRPARMVLCGIAVGLCLVAPPAVRAQPEATIDSLPSETVAYLQRTGDRAAVPETARQLDSWVRGRGATPTGAPVAIFYSDPASTPAEMLFWEVRLPVPPGLTPGGDGGSEVRVLRTEPISRAACVQRRGRPGDDGSALKGLREWVRGQGLEVNGPRHEIYVEGLPGPGPVAMRVCLPVIKR